MATEAATKTGGFRLTKAWVVTLVGCGLATYVVVGNKNVVSGVKVGPAEMTFGPLGAVDKERLGTVAEDVKKGNPAPQISPPAPAAEHELEKLGKLAEEQPVAPTAADPSNVLGTWRDQSGGMVQISPLGGNMLAYNETSSLYGVPLQTAVGQGTWTGGRFEFTFNTLYGTSGVAVLQPGAGGTLTGKAFFAATGMNVPLSLSR